MNLQINRNKFIMVYQGSKNRISKHILPIVTKYLTENRYYVEPFCGGCNLIDKIDHPLRMANDVNKYLIALFEYVLAGKTLPNFIEREEYYKVKANKDDYEDWYVGFVGFLCSMRGKFFDSYAGIIRLKDGKIRNYIDERSRNLINQIPLLHNVIFTDVSYLDLEIPDNSVIYCDPPYFNTKRYRDTIDYNEFWEWCRMKSCNNDVIISEYNAPNDFKCIWNCNIKSIVKGKAVIATEKLFVHKSLYEKYVCL